MKLTKLEIRKPDSWKDQEKGLVFYGAVQFVGETGEQTIVLSPSSISSIINVIAGQVAAQAKRNAAAVGSAIDDAVQSAMLLEYVAPNLD